MFGSVYMAVQMQNLPSCFFKCYFENWFVMQMYFQWVTSICSFVNNWLKYQIMKATYRDFRQQRWQWWRWRCPMFACLDHNFVILSSIDIKLGVPVSCNETKCRCKELKVFIGYFQSYCHYITFAWKGHNSFLFRVPLIFTKFWTR